MPTDQERLTSLEQGVSDLNHNVTIIQGVMGSQGADIRVMKEQLGRVEIRLDGMDAHLEQLSRQMQEQFAATNERLERSVAELAHRLDISVAAMNNRFQVMENRMDERFAAIMALLTGNQPKPPEP